MEKKDLKKLLAGLGIVTLISGGSAVTGCASSGSGWSGDKDGAGSAVEKAQEEVKKNVGDGGWSGTKDGAGSAVKEEVEKKAGDSGWSGTKDSAGSAEEKKPEKKAGDSGWSGTK